MKKLFLILLIASFGLIAPKFVSATHFAGSDLTYTCLGGNTYLISLSFYRDCSGATAPTNVTINFACSSNPQFNFSATLNAIPGTGQEVTPGCNAMPTKCSGTSNPNYGLQEYVYRGTVTLVPCNSWKMSYTDCCRNPVTTVPGNNSNSWYIWAQLNNLQAPCNSSPTFSNKPIAVACNGQSFCFNHGALDPNGDSLVYSFYGPNTTSAVASVIYAPGYTAQNFVASVPPITLDPLTGDICFTATVNVVTVTGMRVEEWRKINGVQTLVGIVNRDIQLKIDNCTNTLPQLSGMDTLSTHTYSPTDTTYQIEMCLGPTLDFDINGYDADVYNPSVIGRPDIFHISWNQGIPQGTFTTHHNGTDSAYAHFNWTPTSADVSNIPKCFTVTIHDEACPYYGSQTFSYCVTVRGMAVDIGPSDTLLCHGESMKLTAIADTTTVNYIWKWNGVPTGTPQNDSTYTLNTNTYSPGIDTLSIETNDGSTTLACPGRDFIIVNHVLQPDIQGTLVDSAFCAGNSVTYNAGPGTTYFWMKLNPAGFIGASSTQTITSSGQYTVYVDGGVNTRCVDQDTFWVASIPNPNLGLDTCIWLSEAPFVISAGIYPDPNIRYLWNDNSTDTSISVNQSGNYTVSLYDILNPNVKCSDSKVVNVIDQSSIIMSAQVNALDDNISEDPIAGDRTICSHMRLRLQGPEAPTGHSYAYQWTKNNSIVTTQNVFILKETSEGNYTIALNVGGCIDDIIVTTEHCLVSPPNVITPNNVDGKNDYFHIEGLENFPDTKLQIFNRWGKKIYESNNYQNDWNGDGASDGIYNWVLYLADGRGTTMHGTLTIISK
jgi:gliding motility-associated-like protein